MSRDTVNQSTSAIGAHWRRSVVVLLLLVYALVHTQAVLRARTLPATLDNSLAAREPLHDYFMFFIAGEMVNEGQIDLLYTLDGQQACRSRYLPASPAISWCAYMNPPHYAWLMSFMTGTGYAPSLTIWRVLSLAAFAAVILIWHRWLGSRRLWPAAALAVLMPAFAQTILLGQNTAFTLLVFAAFCGLLMNGRDGAAGLVLSLLAYKLQFLLVPAALLLAKGRWRAVGGLAAGGMATLLLTALALGPGIILEYLSFAARLGGLMQSEGFRVAGQHSWYGFFQLLGQGWMPVASVRVLTLTMVVASLLLLAAIWQGAWSARTCRGPLQLSSLIVAVVLTSPHLFYYDTLLLALAAVLWWAAASASGPDRRAAGWLIAAGFAWLWLGSTVTPTLPVQFTAPLMFAWLTIIAVRLRRAPAAAHSLSLEFAGA